MAIVKRSVKGSELTFAEMDNNFQENSESDKRRGTLGAAGTFTALPAASKGDWVEIIAGSPLGLIGEWYQCIVDATPAATPANWIKIKGTQESGWAVYVDSLHTSGSPQTVSSGATAILTNNSNLVIDSQIPFDATPPLWNSATNKFPPIKLNDYYTWIVRFKAKNTAAQGAYINVGIDIGGSFGTIFVESKAFIRGAGVEQTFNIPMSGYSGSTFMANGGIPKLTSFGGDTTIYEKEFHIVRHHTGR